ncbi:MAG TPA: cation-translocating P-type ATPase [Ktedonobacteraceae bacterium]
MATELQQVELHVPGLCCLECSQGVETALRHTPGVQALRVLSMAEKVFVTYDATTTEPVRLAQVVTDAGHPVTTWNGVGTDTTTRPFAQASAKPSSQPRSTFVFALLRLAFVGTVSLLALVEIAGESLGLFHRVEIVVPVPLALAVVIIGGYPIFWSALRGLWRRQITINAVMSVGILAAAVTGEVISAALIVFFMLIARYLEGKTTGQARRAIAELAELTPKTARVKREGAEETVAVAALHLGDQVVVREGEQIPIDGLALLGQAIVNQAPITGESLPVEKTTGDEVFAGTLMERGYLEVTVQRMGAQTALGRIIHLVEEAETQKSPVQKFADRFSALFLPFVLTLAGLTFLISHHLEAAIAVLVAACPCAVGLATPLSVVAAVGAGARHGLLIKGGLTLEQLAKVDTLVVDKTGTLTTGRAQVTELVRFDEQWSEDDLLAWAAALEQTASHPLASAILQAAAERNVPLRTLEQIDVRPSRGIVGQAQGETWLLGSWRLLEEEHISLTPAQQCRLSALEEAGQTVLVRSNQVLGAVAVAETLRPEVRPALAKIRAQGMTRLIVLTGDNERAAQAMAQAAGISEVHANLLPEDKIALVRHLQAEGRRVLMVGDGINDAPALTAATVGIAMGTIGTAVAQEAADVALLRDDWHQVPEAIQLGRRTARTIRQNIFFGVGFTMLVMGLASFGLISSIIAAASQSVPDVGVALNASRLLRWKR